MTWGKLKIENAFRSGAAVKMIYILAGILFLFMIVACAFAGAADRLMYIEEFETGKVEISLQELTSSRRGGAGSETDLILAGETLRYAPRIVNEGNDCFVRAQICVTADDDELPGSADDYIYGMDSDWIKVGEYYYFKNILKQGEYTDLIDGVSVPEEWTEDTAGAVTVSVRAEAIQSINFQPDFDSKMPWGAVLLEEIADGGNAYRARAVSTASEVTFDSAGSFQCNTADLFDSFKGVMPGDRLVKTVTVKNSSGNLLDLAMKIHADSSFVNEKIYLTVSCGNKTIFEGTAVETGMKGKYELGTLPQAGEHVITVMLELPAGAGNEYAELEDSIIWELAAEDTGTDGVQTGDPSDMKPFAIAAAVAVSAMIILAVYKRKECK